MDVLESETLLQSRLASTIAVAAMHSHPKVDIVKGMEHLDDMYNRAISAIPYLVASSGVDREAAIEKERNDGIAAYRKMQQERAKKASGK